MNAVISGRAGRALVLDGELLTSIDVEDSSNRVPRRPSDLPYLFGESQDLRVIENSDIESISRELKADADLNLALDFILISLDEELEEDIRKDALQDLDEVFTDNQLVVQLENILYARPLPEDGDLVGALKLCTDAHLPNVLSFLQRFEEHQSVITEVSAAWETIPTRVFGSHDHQAEFQHLAVREGLFRGLVIALASPQQLQIADPQPEIQAKLSTFFLNAGLNPSVKGLPNHRQVMQSWTNSFRFHGDAVTIKHEMEDEEREAAPRRRHGRRVGIDRPAVLREVNRQKEIISAAILRRDFESVRGLTEDLVDYQLKSGETKHLAKSLCDLAMEAKELGMFSLQLELTERSVGMAADDSWSWAQHADALLNMQRLDDALRAYEQADAFGAGAVAMAGRAAVLKAQGQFDAALTAFDEVIREHPDDVFAKNGRAEVLKAQGRFEDALTAFDEVIREHPDNAVAKTGRAEVLKAQGRFGDALATYNEIRLQYPNNAIVRNGRSCVLAALERYDEALEELPADNPVGLQDWIGFHIRGMILMRMKGIEEAVQIFQRGVTEVPFPLSVAYFQTALAVALILLRKYEDAGSVLSNINAPNLQPQIDVLRLHVSGETERFEEANSAFQHLTPKPWSIPGELLDELHRRYILKAPPRQSDDWVFDQEVGSLLLVANQQASISSYAY